MNNTFNIELAINENKDRIEKLNNLFKDTKYGRISLNKLNKIKSHFLTKDYEKYETVYYYRDEPKKNGKSEFIITDEKIKRIANIVEVAYWEDIDQIEYSDNCFIFNYEGNTQELFHYSQIAENEFEAKLVLIHIQYFCFLVNIPIKRLYELLDLKDYQSVLDVSFNLTYDRTLSNRSDFHYIKALALFNLGKYDEALIECKMAIDIRIMKNMKAKQDYYVLISNIYHKLQMNIKSLKSIEIASKLYSDVNTQLMFLKMKDICYQQISETFINIDYHERKFVVIESSLAYLQSDDFIVLKKDFLPKNIQFPPGHPVEREIYICHPIRHNYYLPYKNHESIILEEKISEFRYLLQCLGATKLVIEETNLLKKENNTQEKLDIKLDGSAPFVDIDANFESNEHKMNNANTGRSLTIKQEMNVTFDPYLPDDLLWFKYEPSWIRLADQRLKGHILYHEEKISISNESFTSNNERLCIEIAFKNLISNINLNIEYNSTQISNSSSQMQRVVKVRFAPKDSLSK